MYSANCRLADSQTHMVNIFTAGMLCSLPILRVQQFSNEARIATGVTEKL